MMTQCKAETLPLLAIFELQREIDRIEMEKQTVHESLWEKLSVLV